jgi:hypothetical protein
MLSSSFFFAVVTGEVLVWDLNSLYRRKQKEIWRIPLPELVSTTSIGKLHYNGGEWAVYQINRPVTFCIMNLHKKLYHIQHFDCEVVQCGIEDDLLYFHRPTHIEIWDLSMLLTSQTCARFSFQLNTQSTPSNGVVVIHTLRKRVFIHSMAWNQLYIYDLRRYHSSSSVLDIQPQIFTLPQGVKVWSISLNSDLKYMALVINQSTLWCIWIYDVQDNGVG